ncbi:LacI family DNA-binding transcriptional regulator [Alkalihalobacillus sp. 1P02AB]|uniref:LacI family DNA-binding transcriptional regulator n=1 Tax=Alkalihalobacillus sp. 1P02AB TaxID=3132260 RepID=UPI0039A6973D
MQKRATLKDIAKEAGVSVATVSYVLNYSEKQKISHETRLKVFNIAKKLHYVPNMEAKSLVNQKSKLIGIIYDAKLVEQPSEALEFFQLTEQIKEQLATLHLDTILIPVHQVLSEEDKPFQQRAMDAVIVVGIKEEMLKSVTTNFIIPVLFVDCDPNDPIFHTVLTDYEKLFTEYVNEHERKKYAVVLNEFARKDLIDLTAKYFSKSNVLFSNQLQELEDKLSDGVITDVLAMSEMIGLQLERIQSQSFALTTVISNPESKLLLATTKKVVISHEQKAEAVSTLVQSLINWEHHDEIPRYQFIVPMVDL